MGGPDPDQEGGVLTRIRRNRAKTVMKTILVDGSYQLSINPLGIYPVCPSPKIERWRGASPVTFRLQRSLSCGGSIAHSGIPVALAFLGAVSADSGIPGSARMFLVGAALQFLASIAALGGPSLIPAFR